MISFVSTHETVMVYTPVVFVSSSNSIRPSGIGKRLLLALTVPGPTQRTLSPRRNRSRQFCYRRRQRAASATARLRRLSTRLTLTYQE